MRPLRSESTLLSDVVKEARIVSIFIGSPKAVTLNTPITLSFTPPATLPDGAVTSFSIVRLPPVAPEIVLAEEGDHGVDVGVIFTPKLESTKSTSAALRSES